MVRYTMGSFVMGKLYIKSEKDMILRNAVVRPIKN
jgi:hypothetical protein